MRTIDTRRISEGHTVAVRETSGPFIMRYVVVHDNENGSVALIESKQSALAIADALRSFADLLPDERDAGVPPYLLEAFGEEAVLR